MIYGSESVFAGQEEVYALSQAANSIIMKKNAKHVVV